jgi:hypothetical protein
MHTDENLKKLFNRYWDVDDARHQWMPFEVQVAKEIQTNTKYIIVYFPLLHRILLNLIMNHKLSTSTMLFTPKEFADILLDSVEPYIPDLRMMPRKPIGSLNVDPMSERLQTIEQRFVAGFVAAEKALMSLTSKPL